MRLSQRHGLAAALAALSAGCLVLEIALTRLYSALFGHPFAGLAISLALLGVGFGGVLCHSFPWLARRDAVTSRLAAHAGLTGAGAIVALLAALEIKPFDALDAAALPRVLLLVAASTLPFVFAGITVAAALRHLPARAPRIYLADLLGAAAGGALSIVALRFGAPRAVLGVAVTCALSAVLFYLTGRLDPAPGDEPLPRARGAVAASFLIVTTVLLAGDLGASPWAKLHKLRWGVDDKFELTQWNELGLVTVEKATAGIAWLRVDGGDKTAILDVKNVPPTEPAEIGYALAESKGPTLILGAGGGREVRAALKAGQKDVRAVELNPIVVEAVKGPFAKLSGDLYAKPEVTVVTGEARSFLRASPGVFRVLVLAGNEPDDAASSGALALAENGLYTLEAFQDYVAHLAPEGTLVVARPDAEADRVLSLALAALRASGAREPKKHLFACSGAKQTALLVKRTPLADGDIVKLKGFCKRSRFLEVFSPADPHGELHRRLADDADLTQASLESPVDLRPPTDDHPFFFHTVPGRLLPGVLLDLKGLTKEHRGLGLLVFSFAAAVLLAAVLCFAPALLAKRTATSAPLLRPLTYFAGLGAGFAAAEIALVERLTGFLGHPTYALAAGLAALLSMAGLGARLTAGLAPEDAAVAASRRAQLLVVVLAASALGLGPLLGLAAGLPLAARVAVAVLALAPAGLLMGSLGPLGIALVAARSPALVPGCLGVAGIAGVAGAAFATLCALQLGYPAALIAAGLAYLVAAASVPAAPAPGAS